MGMLLTISAAHNRSSDPALPGECVTSGPGGEAGLERLHFEGCLKQYSLATRQWAAAGGARTDGQ